MLRARNLTVDDLRRQIAGRFNLAVDARTLDRMTRDERVRRPDVEIAAAAALDVGLRWQDVDLDASVLHVRQALSVVASDDGPKLTFGEPKTHSGRRTITLDAACIAVLREHRAR